LTAPHPFAVNIKPIGKEMNTTVIEVAPHAVEHGVIPEQPLTGVMGQSATKLIASENPDNYPWELIVNQTARLKLGKNPTGSKIERINLNYEKLEKSVRNDFRRRFPQLLVGPSRDIPAKYNQKLRETVLSVIERETQQGFAEAVKADPENNYWTGRRVDYKVLKDKELGNRVISQHTYTGVEELKMTAQAKHCELQITWLNRELEKKFDLFKQPDCKVTEANKQKTIDRLQNRIDMFSDILRTCKAV
jgi:hypothetical protein